MTTTQWPARRRWVRLAAAIAAVAVAAAITMAAPSGTSAHAAAQSPLGQAGHGPGRGHRFSQEPWIRALLARLGQGRGPAGHASRLLTPGLSAPHPPGVTVQVGKNPTVVLADPATHTVYVANGGVNGTGASISVINAAICNATGTSGCGQTPAAIPDNGPNGLAINHKTHTLYATDVADSTVLVINAATCDAADTSGCGRVLASVRVGGGPGGDLAVDQATDTIYVPNGNGDTVSVINGATCNATDTSGCRHAPATITVGSGPDAVAIDKKTGTLYVANFNDGTVSVVDGATCNAQHTSGCRSALATVQVGPMPVDAAADEAVGTVYVPVFGSSLGAMAMISTAACNAQHTSGCGQAPASTPIGSAPFAVSINPLTQTVYAANQEDSNVSVINATTCNATDTSRCRQRPPAMASGFNGGGVAVDPSTDTVYSASQNNNTVTVLNGAACNATITSGCTRYAPVTAVGTGPQPVAVNQATHTIYVANSDDNTVTVISAAACNPADVSGCQRTWPAVTVGSFPIFGIAVDQASDTVYVSNIGDNTISVINGATCNAQVTTGCGQAPATIAVGNCPAGLAINHATATLYVANLCDNTVSVVSMATCNAKVTSGCGQAAPVVAAGNSPIPVGVNQATDTVYVGDNGDSTVSVINGATCNAKVTSGCGQAPVTVAVADSPFGLAVDQQTDTVYVANTGDEFFATGYANLTSSVSVINGAACNGQVTTGCGQAPFAVPVGGFDWDVAVNPATGQVYVDSIADSDLAVINGAACNGQVTTGCQPRLLRLRTGGWPGHIGLDQADGAIYVTDNVDGAVSVFPLQS